MEATKTTKKKEMHATMLPTFSGNAPWKTIRNHTPKRTMVYCRTFILLLEEYEQL